MCRYFPRLWERCRSMVARKRRFSAKLFNFIETHINWTCKKIVTLIFILIYSISGLSSLIDIIFGLLCLYVLLFGLPLANLTLGVKCVKHSCLFNVFTWTSYRQRDMFSVTHALISITFRFSSFLSFLFSHWLGVKEKKENRSYAKW